MFSNPLVAIANTAPTKGDKVVATGKVLGRSVASLASASVSPARKAGRFVRLQGAQAKAAVAATTVEVAKERQDRNVQAFMGQVAALTAPEATSTDIPVDAA